MANTPLPISGLTLIESLASADLLVVVDSTEEDITIRTKKATLQQVINYIAQQLAGQFIIRYKTVSTETTINIPGLVGMSLSEVEYDGKSLNQLVTTDYTQPDEVGNVIFNFAVDTNVEIIFKFYPAT